MWQTKNASAVPKNLRVGVNFQPCSEGGWLFPLWASVVREFYNEKLKYIKVNAFSEKNNPIHEIDDILFEFFLLIQCPTCFFLLDQVP